MSNLKFDVATKNDIAELVRLRIAYIMEDNAQKYRDMRMKF